MGRRPLIALPEWQGEEGKRAYRKHVRWLRKLLRNASIGRTPLINMRIDEAGRLRTLAILLEHQLDTFLQTNPEPERNPRPCILLVEAIGKAHQRWRSAVLELLPNAPVAGMGLADIMKPIILRANRVLAEAEREEQEREKEGQRMSEPTATNICQPKYTNQNS